MALRARLQVCPLGGRQWSSSQQTGFDFCRIKWSRGGPRTRAKEGHLRLSYLFLFLLVKFALAARARFDVSGGRRLATRVRRLLMLAGLRAEEMQAEGCQREIKALQCTVHKVFSFSFLVLCSGLRAAAADPLLPPASPVTHYWFPFTVPLMCVQIMAECGRDWRAGGGVGVGRACVRCSFFIP